MQTKEMKMLVYVTGSEKGGTSRKTLIFTTFETVTTPRPSEPLASRYLYRHFRPSTSQIRR